MRKDSNNIVIIDTTYMNSNASDTFAFYTNGKCAIARYPSPFFGNYKLVGNTLFIPDTIGSFPTQFIDTITSLTEHSLTLIPQTDIAHHIANNDTTIYTWYYVLSYSR